MPIPPVDTLLDKTYNLAPYGVNQTNYARNFLDFLQKRHKGQPFCFWYEGYEPHKLYRMGTGVESGKNLDNIKVPGFLPDVPEYRSYMADYFYEIEWFDLHLGRMIQMLDAAGELDNTIIVVTSDHGMPFARAKANLYEYGIHVPLAVRWGDQIKPRRMTDLVSLIDFSPTFLEVAGIGGSNLPPRMQGKSLLGLLLADKSGLPVYKKRNYVIAGREQHSPARWHDLGYPGRAIRTARHLYIRNYKPERWPAGAPVRLTENGQPDKYGRGYYDIDDFQLEYTWLHRQDAAVKSYLNLAVGKRPGEELYDILKDPDCLHNLALDPSLQSTKLLLSRQLEKELANTRDPRYLGNGDVLESYPRHTPKLNFPKPDWAK